MTNEDKKTTSRASQTRAKTLRKKVWTPPSYLDTPNAPTGFRHRWVRVEILGYVDTKNIQGRLRSGYELVRADAYPEDDYPVIADGKYAGVIGHGGLVLTRVPEEIARQRAKYSCLDCAISSGTLVSTRPPCPITPVYLPSWITGKSSPGYSSARTNS